MFRAIANSVCDTRDFFYGEQERVTVYRTRLNLLLAENKENGDTEMFPKSNYAGDPRLNHSIEVQDSTLNMQIADCNVNCFI
jgi:hypothetical protein